MPVVIQSFVMFIDVAIVGMAIGQLVIVTGTIHMHVGLRRDVQMLAGKILKQYVSVIIVVCLVAQENTHVIRVVVLLVVFLIAVAEEGGDTTAPACSITGASEVNIDSTGDFSASATDASNVSRVEIERSTSSDGSSPESLKNCTGLSSSPGTCEKTGVTFANPGTYYVGCHAFDNSSSANSCSWSSCGADGVKTVTVTDTTSPTCIISGPVTAIIGESNTYSSVGSDNNSVSEVNIYSAPVSDASSRTTQKSCTSLTGTPVNCVATGGITFNTPGDYYVGCTASDHATPVNSCTGAGNCGASDTLTVHVTYPNPWWQVKDNDVQTGGNLTSMVSVGSFFNLDGPGGFPGISIYGEGTNLTSSNVSSNGWLVNSMPINPKVFSYDSFAKMIPEDILTIMNNIDITDVAASLTSGGTADSNGYYWYKYDGALNSSAPLTIPTTNINDRKVIVMVDNADLNITGGITLNSGTGFFMVVVNGKITVDPSLGGGSPDLMGIYFSDGVFDDSLGGTKFSVKGSVAAVGGISMQRDLRISGGNNDTPAEYFEYDPSQIMLFPKVFGTHQMRWKEVAP